MQIPLFGGPTEFLATRGPRNATDPRSESGEDWIELLNYVPFSADHHAVTTFQSPDAAACAHVDIMNSFRGQFLCATNVIDVVRIAAVDDRVARFQWFGKCRDGFFSRRTGWEHDPEGARCAELFNEFLERVGRRWTFFRECINVFPVSVEHNALMPALSQASRHVSTHPAKANHSNLHIYFAKVVLVEEPKNCEGAVRYPQWNMQRLLFAWCSFAQMGPTPPRTLRKISAAASMPNGGAVK